MSSPVPGFSQPLKCTRLLFMRAGADWKFKAGMVVTIEPGLYYRGLGGCRIEDMIHITPGGNELISKAPYTWEIA